MHTIFLLSNKHESNSYMSLVCSTCTGGGGDGGVGGRTRKVSRDRLRGVNRGSDIGDGKGDVADGQGDVEGVYVDVFTSVFSRESGFKEFPGLHC
jgi:hypothetical protein